MSLFRRPVRRRQRRAPSERDDSPDERAAPPTIAPPPKPAHLLSFVDEVDDESDTFRVKKSSHSKKLQKQKHRDRRSKLEKDDPFSGFTDQRHSLHETNGSLSGNEDDDRSKNSRKNDNFPKIKRSVEGMILSGRAAISAGGVGDVSDSDGGDSEDNDDNKTEVRFKPLFRPPNDSVRALLDRGDIPDAATIHAARKKRQQAREIGEFIPLQQNNSDSTKVNHHSTSNSNSGRKREGSRLVREDGEGDASDEDPDRIDVRGVAVETSRKERIQLAQEEGPGSDIDSGGEEWETQQIRKAVTQNQIIAVQQETYYGATYVMPTPVQYSEPDVNPFSVVPNSLTLSSLTFEHLKPLVQIEGDTLTPSQLTDALKRRLLMLNEIHSKKDIELTEMNREIDRLRETCLSCTKRAPLLASRYEFYQKLRGYLTDLIECLDEKMPILNALEARAMTLQKRKASFLCERRRSDVRDQAHDVLNTPGAASKKDPGSEERRRRCAEREGRRLRRRRAREQLASGGPPILHREGDSSDDEVPQIELSAYDTTQEQVLADADALFSDTLDEFSSLASVLTHLENWKQRDLSAYVDAYVSLCLPRLAGPFLRLKLLLWNPITDELAPDWDKMQWYRGLMLFGLQENVNEPETEDSLATDPDISLIPNIVQKVILPKITELIEGTWDPMSGAQTRRLASLLRRAGSIPGLTHNSRSITDMVKAVIARIKAALQHDVFIPILQKSMVDSGPRGGCAFLKRQVAAGTRLLNNLVTFYGVIADNTLIPLALEALLQRYLITGIRCSPPVFSADVCWTIATCLPKPWLDQERSKPPLQLFLVGCQEVLSNLADNVLHLKAIEQVRTTIGILTGQSSTRKD